MVYKVRYKMLLQAISLRECGLRQYVNQLRYMYTVNLHACADFISPCHHDTVSLCVDFVSTLLLSVCARTLLAHDFCQSVCGLHQPMLLSVCVRTSSALGAMRILSAHIAVSAVCVRTSSAHFAVSLCANFVSPWCCQSVCGLRQLPMLLLLCNYQSIMEYIFIMHVQY